MPDHISLSRLAPRAALCLVAGLCGALVVAFTGDAEAKHAPARTSGGTHLLARASDHVVLHYHDPDGVAEFRRANADGTLDATEFVVPDGHALVVTDFEFVGEIWSGTNITTDINTKAVFRLLVENKANATTAVPVLLHQPGLEYGGAQGPSLGRNLIGGFSVSVAAGVTVGSNARLRMDIVRDKSSLSSAFRQQSFGPTDAATGTIVRGYLAHAE